jgi:hypothetical protein
MMNNFYQREAMKTIEEPMTMTQRAVNELATFNAMIEKLQPYESLTVAANGYKVVSESRKEVKRLRIAIEAKREELKKGALEYGRAVDGTARQLREVVERIENKLIAEETAFEKAREEEKRKREEERQAKKQTRINSMVAIGLTVDWVAVDLPESEWLEWIAVEDRKYQERLAIEAEEKRLAEQRAEVERLEAERIAAEQKMRDEEAAAESRRIQEEESRRQAEELRIRAEDMERQRIADEQRLQAERRQLQAEREEMEAKLAEQRKAAETEREEMRRQQEEIRKAEQAKLEEQRAEERKRHEDAMKPELDRLEDIMQRMLKFGESLMEPMPWWSGQFAYEYIALMNNMREIVCKGEQS